MAGVSRLERLGELAKEITGLPVADQIRLLGNAGLRTEDINWRVPRNADPGLVTRIPIVGEGNAPASES